jgi:predicted flap endonuclease-1-like 5' DNA nuclease
MKILEIEGIGPVHAAALEREGVATTEVLLSRGASASGRRQLEEATGISHALILEWVNHADLMRIDGVGSEYSDLLEAAGVDSPAELAHRNAGNLAVTFQEVVAARPDMVRRIPGETEISGWIAQAATLPKVVTHGGSSGGSASHEPAAPPASAAQPASGPAPAPAAVAPASSPAPAPAVTAPPAVTASPARLTSPAPARPDSLWTRIKRMVGLG